MFLGAMLGRDLEVEDVLRFWREVCGRTACPICGNEHPPIVGEGDSDAEAAIVLPKDDPTDPFAGHPQFKRSIYTICSNCGATTRFAAERLLHWKTKGE